MQIRIGTRKSPLALAQASEVREALAGAWPELEVKLVPMDTSGDTFADRKLTDIGGKGLFTKEIEEALLAGKVDIAVHSVKDMQTVLPDGLFIGCMLEREDPCDVLVGEGIKSFDDLPKGAKLGTSSLRRAAQALMKRPDLKIVPLRGNVQTRLDKLKKGEMRAILLARAGLHRLGLFDVPAVELPVDEFLPAVGQGAIGVECRDGDTRILDFLAPIADVATEQAVLCERAFLRVLDGSCRTPIAGHAEIEGDILRFRGLIARPDGSAFHDIVSSGKASDAHAIGSEAGAELLEKAGKKFIS